MSRAAEPTRRARTRHALREAALHRFVTDGFGATSIADIAGDVGVTPRTFYRYFASKDEVLFADYEARLDWFRRALSVRPAGACHRATAMSTMTSRVRSSAGARRPLIVHRALEQCAPPQGVVVTV